MFRKSLMFNYFFPKKFSFHISTSESENRNKTRQRCFTLIENLSKTSVQIKSQNILQHASSERITYSPILTAHTFTSRKQISIVALSFNLSEKKKKEKEYSFCGKINCILKL